MPTPWASAIGEAIRLTEKDKICVPVPLYHCFGMVMANLGALTHGATLVYPAEGTFSTPEFMVL
ncbi:MAG TPA: AMP-binding protein, partial [Phycisphaerae bacterium]|nr:AMP-binding protein [Phycisphaerae bacterium]